MEGLLAMLAALGAVAGVLQLAVTLIEAKARRLQHPTDPGVTAPAHRPRAPEVGDHRPTPYEEPDQRPPIDPERLAIAVRASLAYLLGLIGTLIFRRSGRQEVRFHAMQSMFIDIAGLLYLMFSLCLVGAYISIRYPGEPEIPQNDAVMWFWSSTVVLGPPSVHIALSIAALLGRHPKIPIIWKLARTIAYRPPVRKE